MVHAEVGRVGRGKEAEEGCSGRSGALGVAGGREDCGVGSHSWRNAGKGWEPGRERRSCRGPRAPERGESRDFAGGPVLRTGVLKAEGPGSTPGKVTKIPKAAVQQIKKKKKKEARAEGRRERGSRDMRKNRGGRGHRQP